MGCEVDVTDGVEAHHGPTRADHGVPKDCGRGNRSTWTPGRPGGEPSDPLCGLRVFMESCALTQASWWTHERAVAYISNIAYIAVMEVWGGYE